MVPMWFFILLAKVQNEGKISTNNCQICFLCSAAIKMLSRISYAVYFCRDFLVATKVSVKVFVVPSVFHIKRCPFINCPSIHLGFKTNRSDFEICWSFSNG